MEQINIEKYLLNDDTFFFCLLLSDYPRNKKNIFYFSDFSSLRFKNLGKDELLSFLVYFRNNFGVKLGHPNNENTVLWNLVNDKSLPEIRRFFKQNNKAKIETLFDGIDFRIFVPNETQIVLRKSREEYIEDFMKSRLIKWQKNYALFKEQKNVLLEKIKNEIQDFKSNLVFCDTDVYEKCKFFDIMFALEKLKIIKIIHFYNVENESERCFYKIAFFVNREEFLRVKNKIPKIQTAKEKHIGRIETEHGTDWKDITIKLKENYDIEIKIKDAVYKTNHELMGFSDRRNESEIKIKKCWDFLKNLSLNNNVFLFKQEPNESKTDYDQRKKELSKRKQELSKILKKFFPFIPGDPFEKYDKEKESYKIKIKLIPEKTFRPDFLDRKIIDEREKFNDLDEYYQEETPSMLEKEIKEPDY